MFTIKGQSFKLKNRTIWIFFHETLINWSGDGEVQFTKHRSVQLVISPSAGLHWHWGLQNWECNKLHIMPRSTGLRWAPTGVYGVRSVDCGTVGLFLPPHGRSSHPPPATAEPSTAWLRPRGDQTWILITINISHVLSKIIQFKIWLSRRSQYGLGDVLER